MTDTGKEETEANRDNGAVSVVSVAAKQPEAEGEPAELRRWENQDWAELCQSVSWSQVRSAPPPSPPPIPSAVAPGRLEVSEAADIPTATSVEPIPVEAFEAWMRAEDPAPEDSLPEEAGALAVVPVPAPPIAAMLVDDGGGGPVEPAAPQVVEPIPLVAEPAKQPSPAGENILRPALRQHSRPAPKPRRAIAANTPAPAAKTGEKLSIPVTDMVSEAVILTSRALHGLGFGGPGAGSRRVPAARKPSRNPGGAKPVSSVRPPAAAGKPPGKPKRPAPGSSPDWPFARVADTVEREMEFAVRWMTGIGSGLVKRAQQVVDTAAARLSRGSRVSSGRR
jgi:hypothetical protein